MCVYLASQCLTEAAVFHIGEQQSVATPTHLQRLGQGTQRGYANVILCDVRNGAVCALYGGRERTNAVGCLLSCFPSYTGSASGELGERWIAKGGTCWSGAGLGVCSFES